MAGTVIATPTDAQTVIAQLRTANPSLKFWGNVYGSSTGTYTRILVSLPSRFYDHTLPYTIHNTGVTYDLTSIKWYSRVLSTGGLYQPNNHIASNISMFGNRFVPLTVNLIA